MENYFNPIQLLDEIYQSATTGQLQVTGNSVTWELYFLRGKLLYAKHSLQSWEAIAYYLVRLGCDNLPQSRDSSRSDGLPCQVLNLLVARGILNSAQQVKLVGELTQDALESLLCLKRGQEKWLCKGEIPSLNMAPFPLEIPALIATLGGKLQKWYQLNPSILSPHQRPSCPNPALLERSVPSGKISVRVLKQLVKLMEGMTIRQLSLRIKQDELKVAQLLCPYVKNKILQLDSPPFPLSQLPLMQSPDRVRSGSPLPRKQPLNPTTSHTSTTSTPIGKIRPSEPARRKSKIVCIDDSPSMLEIVQSYLGTEKYELLTIENPMKSLSYLFKSKPDLILMDISMPGINGNRLCKILKSSSVFEQVPIVLISGNTKILNQETIQTIGATDFLAKPFTQQSLLDIIEKHGKSSLALA